MEIDGKDLNKVGSGIVILLVIVFGIQYINTDKDQEYVGLLANMLDKKYEGVILEKFIDYDNHAMRTIILNNGSRASINSDFYTKINIGDSISKKEGDSIIWLYKNKDTLTFDYKEWVERIKRLKKQQRSE